MNLKRKLLESELLGVLHRSLSVRLGRLFENPADEEKAAAIRKTVVEENRFVSTVVKKLLNEHPGLEPSRFGIPSDRYEPLAFFATADAAALLMRRFCHLLPKGFGARRLILCSDGRVLVEAISKDEIPAPTMQSEVSEFISAYYIPRPEEMTHNPLKATRRDRDRIRGVGVEHARAFLRWLTAAVQIRPGLLMGFRAIRISPDGQKITLQEVAMKIDDDPLEGWLTKP